jgi:1-acyl-sn-glycerol-3-phosphate acyltransferase
VLRPLVWNETRPRVEGLDRLEGLDPPVMFVSNHSSHLDAPLVLCSLPKPWRQRTAVGAAADYFFDVWWRAAGTALVFNAFPIERSGGKRSTGTARKLVEEGWSVLVFPEGTRSRDGWVQRFRLGAARLCAELALPAVPVVIRGAYAAMPRGRGWPRPGRPPISVRFGRPVVPEAGEHFRTFSRRMFEEVVRTWDEDRTTWWESLHRPTEEAARSLQGPAGPRWRRVWDSSRILSSPGDERAWRKVPQ